MKRERLDFLADNARYTKRFAHYVGHRCRSATIKDIAKELLPELPSHSSSTDFSDDPIDPIKGPAEGKTRPSMEDRYQLVSAAVWLT